MKSIIIDIKHWLIQKSRQYNLDRPKISVLKTASKVMSFVIVFSIFPVMENSQVNNQPASTTRITFNQKSPFVLDANESKNQIEIGKSVFDIANPPRISASIKIKATNNIVHTDPLEYRPVYQAAAKQFSIPWQLIEAVHEVESGKSGSTSKRSSAGAQGPMQFMPGTWRGYQIDGNNDGMADITDVTDSIYTGAHYLATSGADEGRIDDALFNYNHSLSYVSKVKKIALEIGMTE